MNVFIDKIIALLPQRSASTMPTPNDLVRAVGGAMDFLAKDVGYRDSKYIERITALEARVKELEERNAVVDKVFDDTVETCATCAYETSNRMENPCLDCFAEIDYGKWASKDDTGEGDA
jgi:hypothetical protein